MANPRASMRVLKLSGSKNIERAKSYAPAKSLAKRGDLEALYAELQERRKRLLADVAENGEVINQENSNSRGMIYLKRIANPAMALLHATELKLIAIAKLLTEASDDSSDSDRALDAELDQIRKELKN